MNFAKPTIVKSPFGEISFVAGDVVSLVGLGFLFTAWGKE